MSKRKHHRKTFDEVADAEGQIKELLIPYDYDTKEYPIEVLLQKFRPRRQGERANMYIPTYQRDLVWKAKEQSRFIESILLGVPIQPIFAAYNPETSGLEIIDGSQRVRTLDNFESGKLKLQDLEKLTTLNGFTFDDLPQFRQNKFLLVTIRFHVITEKADFAIRADIFDRINTYGKVLTRSEVRKGALAGPFYNFVMACAKNPLFKSLCPIKKERGEGDELVLRFFAYAERYLLFKHDVFPFLDRFLKEKNEQGFDLPYYQKRFDDMLAFVHQYFPYGFRKTLNENTTPRVRFEAISVGVHLALEERPDLTVLNVKWLESAEFKALTTADGSNNSGRLKKRIEFVRNCLLGTVDTSLLDYATS